MRGRIQIGFFSEVEDKISLNIYLSGCRNNKKCYMKECHNHQMRSFLHGDEIHTLYPRIQHALKSSMVDVVVLLGGEPFDQELRDLIELIDIIRKVSNKPIYAYTGYEIDEVANMAARLGIERVCAGPYRGALTDKRWYDIDAVMGKALCYNGTTATK